jgi:hypothetical protein
VSEYQYYEFRALERPLSAAQQAELRNCSTRAEITSTSFINEYHWGDLKAEPLDWMARHFDAHVYSANWGCCHFMLGVPLETLDRATVLKFSGGNARGGYGGHSFSILERDGRWILTWSLDLDGGDNERFNFEDGHGWMKRLLALRQELMSGDLRPLYLGWMARLCSCDLDDEALEPAPPPGLRELTPAQAALAEFLMLDPDLLSVAVSTSAPIAQAQVDLTGDAAAWAETLPAPQLHLAAAMLATGRAREAEREMAKRFAIWRKKHGAAPALEKVSRRTVAQIEEGREAAERLRLDKERRQRERREQKAQLERNKRLAEVASRAEAIWQEIEQLLLRATGASYTQAESAVIELAQALTAAGHSVSSIAQYQQAAFAF